MTNNREAAPRTDTAALRELDQLARHHRNDTLLASDIVDIVGVVSDIKPAAMIEEGSVSNATLSKLGLEMVKSSHSEIIHLLYVAKTRARAQQLADAHALSWGLGKRVDVENERTIGRLLGYPSSATEYFIKRLDCMGSDAELPMVRVTKTLNTTSEYFQQLILSPDNWRDELAAYCEPLEVATRQSTPAVYDIFVRAARRNARRARWQQWTSRLRHRIGSGPRTTEISDDTEVYV